MYMYIYRECIYIYKTGPTRAFLHRDVANLDVCIYTNMCVIK